MHANIVDINRVIVTAIRNTIQELQEVIQSAGEIDDISSDIDWYKDRMPTASEKLAGEYSELMKKAARRNGTAAIQVASNSLTNYMNTTVSDIERILSSSDCRLIYNAFLAIKISLLADLRVIVTGLELNISYVLSDLAEVYSHEAQYEKSWYLNERQSYIDKTVHNNTYYDKAIRDGYSHEDAINYEYGQLSSDNMRSQLNRYQYNEGKEFIEENIRKTNLGAENIRKTINKVNSLVHFIETYVSYMNIDEMAKLYFI